MKNERLSKNELLLQIEKLNNILNKCKNNYKNIPVMMQSVDHEGRLIHVSSYWLEKMGYLENEVIGVKLIDLLTESSRQYAVEAAFPAFLESGFCSDIPLQFIRKNGTVLEGLFSGTIENSLFSEDLSLLAVIVDITEQKRIEERLRKSEESFRFLAENAKDMIYHMTISDAVYEYVSPASLEIFGYTPEEFYNTPLLISKIIHPDWNEYFKKEWQNLTSGNIPDYYEYQIIHKTGEIKWVNQRNTLVRDEHGTPVAIEGIVRDITEHKNTEKGIIETRQFYEDIIEGVQDGIWVSDENDIIFFANKGMENLTGRSREEIQGNNVLLYFNEETTGELITFYRKAKKDKKPVWYDIRITTASSHHSWQNGWLIPRFVEGRFKGVICTSRDNTEKIKAEKKIIEAKETAELYLDMAGSIFVSLDVNGDILLINQKGLEILEYEDSDELIGKNWFDTCIPAYLNDEIKAVFNKVISGDIKGVEHYENEVLTKSSTLKNVAWYNSYIKDSSGHIQYLLSSGIDNSERKAAEIKLKTSLEEKEVLLCELYHRTKNNMQVISSMLGLRAMELDNQQLNDIFKDIENKILSMALVHKKLCESGDLSHINLKEYINELIQQLTQSMSILTRNLETSINCENIQVVFDTAVPFGIVINEIVTNAIKHAFPDKRDGRIDIDLYQNTSDEIILEIRDNGVGMPDAFDLVKDAGFGLRTVRKLVESQLGGSMIIEQNNGAYYRISIKKDIYSSRI